MKLLQTDIDFILAQLTLPGNNPLNAPGGLGTILDSTGIRNTQGVGNNVLNPTWGSADQPFPNLVKQVFGTDQNGVSYSTTDTIGNRGVVLTDSRPRVISNLVANQDGLSTLTVQDAPTNDRLSPVTGNVNPLPYSSFMTLFGQFFDHGLDFVHKGDPGLIAIPLLPSDPLYNPNSPNTNVMYVSRVNISSQTAGVDGLLGTADDVRVAENTVSPFIDLSQSYGSVASHTVFVREYDANGFATGRLVSGANGGMATWADIKANALRIGITLHDKDVVDIPQVALDANGNTLFVTIAGKQQAYLVTNTGTATDSNASGLQTVGHAFLDDMMHGTLADNRDVSRLVNGDLPVGSEYSNNLNAHFIAGDGRANENIGLTAIHDVFHSEHNRVLIDIKAMVLGGTDSYGAVHTRRADAATWTGEMFFQAAKLVTEMEYQHLVFGEFARKLSPNVNAFAGYDIAIDPAITAEFAHAVYRFGHSMLTETVDRTEFDPRTGASTGVENNIGLIQAFLNPAAYAAEGDAAAGQIAIGMSQQVGNAIDEWVTGALRNNLVGLPLDLAAINIARGRDTGTPTLNQVRESLYNQTNFDTSLKPYATWDDFANNLLHPESLINFVQAYARDAILQTYAATGPTGHTLLEWTALQNSTVLIEQQEYAAGLKAAAEAAIADPAFMFGGNTDFNNIDLWLGGLAEAKVIGGMLGSTFDFIFATQMVALQNADRFYYLERLLNTNLLPQIEAQLFSDIVARNTGVSHLYSDIFSVADAYHELSNGTGYTYEDGARFVTINGVTTFFGASADYNDARGVLSPNGRGNASEVIGGTSGDDRINALGGNDTVWGDGGNDIIEGGKGNDFLHGGIGDDTITDSEGDDLIWGDAGNDAINGGVGIDQLFGGDGNDTIYGGRGADIIDGGAGDDVLFGDADADVISGGAGNDVLYGGEGADALDGGEGNDKLYGGAGVNGMIGWDGDDTFVMDVADLGFNNTMDGGLGFDTVDYSQLTNTRNAGVAINLANAGVAVVLPGTNVPDAFVSVEAVIGSQYNDTIIGDGFNNLIEGNTGNDTLDGGLGVDTVSYRSAAAAVTVNLANGTATGGAGADSLVGFENIYGSAYADNLTGDAGNNVIEGGAGADIIDGGAGDDFLYGTSVGVSSLDIDTVSYASAAAGVTVNLSTLTAQNTVGAGIDVLAGFTNLSGSAFNDTLTGDGSANAISGGNGNDTILGGGGNDTLDGGNGDDRLDGGAGNDTMTGGAGNDTYVVDSVSDVVTEGAGNGSGTDTISTSLNSYTLAANLENLTYTGVAAFTGIGNASANVITGSTNADRITGLAGADTLTGGSGADTFIYTATAESGTGLRDLITDFVAGTDKLDLSAIDAIQGTGSGTQQFTWIGTAAFTALGQLRYTTAGGVTTVEANVSGNNNADMAINMTGALTLTAADFVNVINGAIGGGGGAPAPTPGSTLTGSNVLADVLTGGAGNDTLSGLGGNDTLNGLAGDDTLLGGSGNDNLTGGLGADTMTGGAGSDRFIINANDSTTLLRDIITDFVRGQDRINISGIDANSAVGGDQAFTTIVASAANFTAAAQLRYYQVGAATIVEGNTDANFATAEFSLQLNSQTLLPLAIGDFIA